MKIHPYDRVLLKDGRTATIVHILAEGEAYMSDIDLPDYEWETVQITHSDIADIIKAS